MSTSAILPISSVPAPAPIDYDSSSATSAQQAVFNSILTQLQQSVSVGDLPSSQTLLNAVQAISPSASTGTTPLATFLASVSTAISNGSASQAQAALATYQNAAPTSSTAAPALSPTANPNAVAAQIAASLIQNENQLLLVNALDNPNTSATSSTAGSNSASSLIGILNAAYPSSGTSSSSSPSSASGTAATTSATEATTSGSPYDALVSSIQASLAAGNGTITPALAYLQAAGNFVNTSA
jgi:polyhydroxyalkanoate synthase subunit PhaC